MNIVVIIEGGCVVGVYSTDPAIKEVAVIDLDEDVDREDQINELINSPGEFEFPVEQVANFSQIKL
jgi:hypothetical protein